MPQLATVALLSQRRNLYCLRLGEFTGFERARRSWVTQPVLRRHASSRATPPPRKREQIIAEVPSFAVVSYRNPEPGNSFPRSLSQLHKSLLHINQFHSPLFLVMRLVLALPFFKALLASKGVDNVVTDDSDADEPVPLPGPQSHGARGTGEELRQVGWAQVG